MIPAQKIRLAALVVVASASMAAVATRLAPTSSNAPLPAFNIRAPHSGEQPFLAALFEEIEASQVPGLRIRATECSQPIFIVPLGLASIAQPQMADGLYGRLQSYQSTDVYADEIWRNFGPTSRLMSYLGARFFRGQKTNDIHVFVRIYSPSDCAIGAEAMRQWAEAVLKLGSDGEPAKSDS